MSSFLDGLSSVVLGDKTDEPATYTPRGKEGCPPAVIRHFVRTIPNLGAASNDNPSVISLGTADWATPTIDCFDTQTGKSGSIAVGRYPAQASKYAHSGVLGFKATTMGSAPLLVYEEKDWERTETKTGFVLRHKTSPVLGVMTFTQTESSGSTVQLPPGTVAVRVGRCGSNTPLSGAFCQALVPVSDIREMFSLMTTPCSADAPHSPPSRWSCFPVESSLLTPRVTARHLSYMSSSLRRPLRACPKIHLCTLFIPCLAMHSSVWHIATMS